MKSKKTPAPKKKKAYRTRGQRSLPREEALDGCDVHIGERDATPDEDLPAADGGVAKNGL
jgi:hypothetical protein